ncbi:D-tyrosyl-tRNA(Tyr) deacylase [Syntrophomonas zehnderi OL-4]|uniref:D-aminoacyl-tRNA deacylase n=1 Tax=Syntrophomonas zehnderi OL-4 TaxID=690567 RepID=A0A0E4C8N4_9FIRM|nr:D-aminoacyl-tRNA deacylase [Syntrophomonas zehnderi]CFX61692.1 D-tyrosyl-tRNA(Tyr) deacylase [Syntrophomonas zehnderi OL-4]
MRAVVQKSQRSSVNINNEEIACISYGLVVLLGVKKGDTRSDAEYIMDKIINLRIFEDEQGKMNRSLLEEGGDLLMVSQFTLYGDTRKGRRPSFTAAEDPEPARELFAYCLEIARNQNIRVQEGVFGAHMQVNISNDGPCTILLDSEKIF